MTERPSDTKLFPVKLLRNYVPRGDYEVVGYDKPAVRVKDAAGKMQELEPAEFVKGEMTPAPYPGTGFGTTHDEKGNVLTREKIWAHTHIKLPVEEAKDVIAKHIAERADALPA